MKSRVGARDFSGAKLAFSSAARVGGADVKMYNTYLLGLVKNNESNWEEVYDVTERMAREGVEPDAITYR